MICTEKCPVHTFVPLLKCECHHGKAAREQVSLTPEAEVEQMRKLVRARWPHLNRESMDVQGCADYASGLRYALSILKEPYTVAEARELVQRRYDLYVALTKAQQVCDAQDHENEQEYRACTICNPNE